MHDNNSSTGTDVYLEETSLIGYTRIVTVHPGGAKRIPEVQPVPEVFTISLDIYPNPFNPSTTIEYSIPEESDVQLKIYNMNGKLVKSYVATSQAAGEYEIQWRGDDGSGKKVGAGIYIASI